ncbi:hypothetical protein AK812_SmicGene46748 [Symbiodinium microadriaticum]|uniref:Uncharacterized protein n=1 Tax=Symbiodinium microadriaticum TaxID=2951 RepID=A0A1Q9BT59_SYMMI|nr:hypothetical protein AK812_SmicGene46748 [Symbiodinium microadriaticum]CAE7225029.1 unnamed protein product [Symbiodinium sp. KB8]
MVEWTHEQAAEALQACDPACLVAPDVLDSCARAIAHPEPRRVHFAHACPPCGGKLGKRFEREASVVASSGVVTVIHGCFRCSARACPLYGRLIWANFVSRDNVREWLDGPSGVWPGSHRDVRMLSPNFGVTNSWHEQFSLRMLKQHASWTSEAQVLGLDAVFPRAAPRMLEKAWLKLQLRKRWPKICADPFVLSEPFAIQFAKCKDQYDRCMARASRARSLAAGRQPTLIVIDGNQKMTRPACCQFSIQQVEGTNLHHYQDCGETRVFKGRNLLQETSAAAASKSTRQAARGGASASEQATLFGCGTCAAYRQRRGFEDVDTDACGDVVTCRTSKMPRRLNRRSGGWLVLSPSASCSDGCPTTPTCVFRPFRFIVDRFHYEGHTDKWCRDNCSPTLPPHEETLENVSTSSCEILFQWFSQYKHAFRHMSRLVGHFFVTELVDMHNSAQAARKRPAPGVR